MKNLQFILCLTMCLAVLVSRTVQAEQKPFMPGSLQQIEDSHADETFIMVFWEINCPPCHEEMAMLGGLKGRYPDMNLVMVGTDPVSMESEVVALQQKYGLAGIESWSFADDNIERLRYGIDPEWFGELPRNYFYDADGSRMGFSGKLNEQLVRDWLLLEE